MGRGLAMTILKRLFSLLISLFLVHSAGFAGPVSPRPIGFKSPRLKLPQIERVCSPKEPLSLGDCFALARKGHFGFLNHLSEGFNLKQFFNGRTLLYWAIVWNDCDVVATLLYREPALANAIAEESTGKRPIHFAAENGSDFLFEHLRLAGARLHLVDGAGNTAFNYAVMSGHAGFALLLLQHRQMTEFFPLGEQKSLTWRGFLPLRLLYEFQSELKSRSGEDSFYELFEKMMHLGASADAPDLLGTTVRDLIAAGNDRCLWKLLSSADLARTRSIPQPVGASN